jgi:integrase
MKIIERVRAMADFRDAYHVMPHAIRHTAAIRMLKRGGDLRSIQQILKWRVRSRSSWRRSPQKMRTERMALTRSARKSVRCCSLMERDRKSCRESASL